MVLLLILFLGQELMGPIVSLLTPSLGPGWAFFATIVVCLATLSAYIFKTVQSNRRGRFVAVGPEAVLIRNSGRDVSMPYATIGTVAIHDAVPWMKQTGQDRSASLIGIFENKTQASLFKRIVSLRSSGQSIDTAFDENELVGPEPLFRSPPEARSRPSNISRRLTWVGGIVIVLGYALGICLDQLGLVTKGSFSGILLLIPIGAGIVILAAGQFLSDPRPMK